MCSVTTCLNALFLVLYKIVMHLMILNKMIDYFVN